jgi:hypothetical protein
MQEDPHSNCEHTSRLTENSGKRMESHYTLISPRTFSISCRNKIPSKTYAEWFVAPEDLTIFAVNDNLQIRHALSAAGEQSREDALELILDRQSGAD